MTDHARAPRRPNILWIIADQLTPSVLPCYGGAVVDAPYISALAGAGTVFSHAYCNSTLCAPSRASMLTGQLPSRIGVYDNGADFASSVPTLAHRMRLAGYRTALSGKMHFVGADQLHGFEERLTTDVFPASFDATPDWSDPDWGTVWELDAVRDAAPSIATFQTEFDEEVTFAASRRIVDAARTPDDAPLFLVASYTHPHDPFEPPPEHWARYADVDIDAPTVGHLPPDQLDPHTKRLRKMYGLEQPGFRPFDAAQILRARRAYYANISFMDDQVGALLASLERTGLAHETVVLFSSDHGEMLGERGLWYKLCFFENSVRIPLVVREPVRRGPARIDSIVSLADVLPTILGWAGVPFEDVGGALAGASLIPLLAGEGAGWPDVAISENLAEGARAPQVMIRRGRYKCIHSAGDPDLLYDLASDPRELENLASDPAHRNLVASFHEEIRARWDLVQLEADVLASQRRRRFVARALASGRPWNWEHTPGHAGIGRYLTTGQDFWVHANRTRLRDTRSP